MYELDWYRESFIDPVELIFYEPNYNIVLYFRNSLVSFVLLPLCTIVAVYTFAEKPLERISQIKCL